MLQKGVLKVAHYNALTILNVTLPVNGGYMVYYME